MPNSSHGMVWELGMILHEAVAERLALQEQLQVEVERTCRATEPVFKP